MTPGLVSALIAALLLPTQLVQQPCPTELIEEGVIAYRELRLDDATELLRRALEAESGARCPDRTRALAYLGASEFFRGDREAAVEAFQNVVIADPRYRPDELVFPPEVTGFFDQVRRDTPAAAVAITDEGEIRAGRDSASIQVVVSTPHPVRVHVSDTFGIPIRDLFRGDVRDSLSLGWDGLDWRGDPVLEGEAHLRVISLTEGGSAVRHTILPFAVRWLDEDRAPGDAGVADAEVGGQEWGRRALGSLALGVLTGTAVLLVPRAVGTSSLHGRGRVGGSGRAALGTAAIVAGAIGFLDRLVRGTREPTMPLLRIQPEEAEPTLDESASPGANP